MKRLTPISSAVLRPLEGDEDTIGVAALVGVVAGGSVDNGGVDEEEKPAEDWEKDEKDDDDDAIIIGLKAAPDTLMVDGPQVCGETASFDVI